MIIEVKGDILESEALIIVVKPIVYRVFENTPITVDLYTSN